MEPLPFRFELLRKFLGLLHFSDGLSNVCVVLCRGFEITLAIFALTLLFSIPLGLLICCMRMSRFKPLAWLMRIYISVMRGTPLMLQLLVVFFGPYFFFGVSITDSYRFPAVIIAFSLNYAAYFAEIYRGQSPWDNTRRQTSWDTRGCRPSLKSSCHRW